MEDSAAIRSRSPTPSFQTAEIGRTLYPSVIQHPGPVHVRNSSTRPSSIANSFPSLQRPSSMSENGDANPLVV
jgi:predicted glutamine amidotransferase